MIELEAQVGRGVGPILFGSSESDLVEYLGDPDKVCNADGEDRRLVYNEIRSSFWFRDDRLHWIKCAHPDLVVGGRKLYGQCSVEVISYLKSLYPENVDSEDYYEWESHTFEDSWIELQFDYDALKEVCLGHLFGEDDEPIWPVA